MKTDEVGVLTLGDEGAAPRGTDAHGLRVQLARLGLLLVGLAQVEVGLWGEISPRGFFANYPGALGQHWVRTLGAYNEHLLRDYAAAELGFAVLLICAAVWFERRLVLVAGAAFLAATVPHFVYHLTRTGSLSAGENWSSLSGFLVELVVVALVMVVAARPARGPGDPV